MSHAGRRQPGIKQQEQEHSEQSEQEQEQRTPSPLSLLPTDLLGQVFEKMPGLNVEWGEKDPNMLSVRAACRWLRDAFDSCNTHIELVGAAAAVSKGSAQRRSYHVLLQHLIARTSGLNSLSIVNWENGRELLKLPLPWGRLKKLDLSDLLCHNQSSASSKPKHQAFGPLACCSALEELDIFGGSLSMSQPDTLPFLSTLRSLRLLDPSHRDLSSIAPLFTALQQLELDCSKAGKLDFTSIAACTGLRQLSLELNAFENISSGLYSLTSLTQLTNLQLYKCDELEDLQPIALLSSLRHLELEDAYNIAAIFPLGSLRSSLERLIITRGNSYLDSEACLSPCTLLRHLDLSGVEGETYEEDSIFDLSVLSACTLLEYLDLSYRLVVGSLEPLLPCTRLQRLYLDGCRQLTALAPIASLERLDISNCEELQELSPLTACTSLRTLNVCCCPRIKSLVPLATCKQLQLLQVSRCVNVTNLEPIAACTKLACLDLAGSTGIKSLVPLSACAELSCLNLDGCSGIKDLVPLSVCSVLELLRLESCDSLANLEPLVACTTLKRLSLQYLAKPIDLVPLAACPSLQLLDLYGCCSSMDLAPLQSCSRLEKLFLADPFYLETLRSLSHLKNLSIVKRRGL